MIVFLWFIAPRQQGNRAFLALYYVAVEDGYEQAILLDRQHGLPRACQRLFQGARVRNSVIEMIGKDRSEIVLEREGHGDDGGYLRHDQRGRQGCIDGGAAMLVMPVLFYTRGFARRKDGQAHIGADEQFAQGCRADIAVASPVVAET